MRISLHKSVEHYLCKPDSEESIHIGVVKFKLLMLLRKASQYTFYQAGERTVEYPWVLQQIKKHLARGRSILDVGCGESRFHYLLLKQGFNVFGLDFCIPKEFNRSMHFVKADAVSLPFKAGSVDAVVALSTVEHIGFSAYGAPIHEDGDLFLVHEIYRILKKEGLFIVTGPFSERKVDEYWHRMYDKNRLGLIKHRFSAEVENYYIRPRYKWKRASLDEAVTFTNQFRYTPELIPKLNGPNALFCYVLRKRSPRF